ncbi:MAG: acyl-CoA dehydratase activase [Promethearchaeota archaeon]
MTPNANADQYYVGLDIGSLTTKIVLLMGKKIVDFKVIPSQYNFEAVGRQLLESFLQSHDLTQDSVAQIVLTGYGRHSLPDLSTRVITEITAHARGVQFYFPKVRSIIDIGGQDSKVIKIDPKSHSVIDFQMNDKCAAGTGRFLEVMAKSLEVEVADFGDLALESKNPSPISSMCTVFAESEVIGLFARGEKKTNIASGIHISIARRVGSMAKRVMVQTPLVFCGGVALNPAVKVALEQELDMKIRVPPNPQIIGALGAALIGQDSQKS